MRFIRCLPMAAIAGALLSSGAANAQVVRVRPGDGFLPGGRDFFADQSRAVIGVSTSGSASSRDTLGLFVSSVRAGGPAEKAGIQEGNRIQSINGVSLRLSPADVGDYEMANVLTRRLTRELDKLKPGDDVDLRVYADGQIKPVKVKTVAPDVLYETLTRARDADRATLGIDIGVNGSSRDSLGVFVMGVEDDGPAAKAGIQEGSRIASINGVDLRGRRSNDEDDVLRSSAVSRLEREISRLKPGDDVDLRVYFNGQSRDVKLKAGRASDLPRHRRSMMIMSDDHAMPRALDLQIDGAQLGGEIRRAMETARIATGDAMVGAGRALGRLGNHVSW